MLVTTSLSKKLWYFSRCSVAVFQLIRWIHIICDLLMEEQIDNEFNNPDLKLIITILKLIISVRMIVYIKYIQFVRLNVRILTTVRRTSRCASNYKQFHDILLQSTNYLMSFDRARIQTPVRQSSDTPVSISIEPGG